MNKPRFGGAFVIWVRSGCGFSKGRDNMAKKTEFDKEIEKWYKGVIKNFTRDSLKIVRSEAAKAGRRAARDMKKVFDSYLQTYYEYQPRDISGNGISIHLFFQLKQRETGMSWSHSVMLGITIKIPKQIQIWYSIVL